MQEVLARRDIGPLQSGKSILDRLQIVRSFVGAAPGSGTPPRGAGVAGNGQEPRQLHFRNDAAPQALQRVDERRLDGVVSVLAAAELLQAEPVDRAPVALVQASRVSLRRADIRLWCCRSDCAHGIPTLTGPTVT